MDILYIITGLVLVLLGAHLLTEGCAATAERFGVSQFVIGLTVIAIGTSMPEFVVSAVATVKGNNDLAVGNVVGSNIFNIFVIMGMCAVIAPIPLTKNNIRFDIPFTLAASVLLFIFTSDRLFHTGDADRISRGEGVLMFLFYVAVIAYSVYASADRRAPHERPRPRMKAAKAAVFILFGLGGLVGGSELFVDGATDFAKRMGLSQSLIAITLVAGGTSLPELASGLTAVIKGHRDMALGNILGSNIFNILFILGGCSIFRPMPLGSIDTVDIMMVLLSALLPLIFSFTFNGRKINRVEGLILLTIYGLFLRHLILKQ